MRKRSSPRETLDVEAEAGNKVLPLPYLDEVTAFAATREHAVRRSRLLRCRLVVDRGGKNGQGHGKRLR